MPKILFLLAASLLGSGFFLHAQAQQNEEWGREATIAFLKKTVLCWQTNDLKTFEEAFDADVIFAYPGGRLNKKELLATFQTFHQDKKDIRIYFGHFVIDGNRFSFEYQFAATNRKTGKRQAVGTAAGGVLHDHHIVVFKEFWDESVAPLQAAGKAPLDEGVPSPFPATVQIRPDLIN